MTISYIISLLDLTVTLIKVKAYSDDRLNKQADKLAKKATFSTSKLILKYMNILDLRFILTYDHLNIKASSRHCVKQLHNAQHFYQYLQLYRNNKIKTLSENYYINWSTTAFMLNYNFT